VELSPNPSLALKVTEKLPHMIPDSGHLQHMPSHIYIQIGQYDKSISSNQVAIIKDNFYAQYAGGDNFYTIYRIHNYHFLLYSAMFDGQSQLAISTARELPKQIPDELLTRQLDIFEGFLPMIYHALIRFGKWQEILDEPLPTDPGKFASVYGIAHYARTIALSSLNRIPEAETEREKFYQILSRFPENRRIFVTPVREILAVAELMMNGELEYRKGNFNKAFEFLRAAVEKEDNFPYDEPWPWMQPARHALGALLLEQKNLQEAEKVYREDLKAHPNNCWSLQGLEECLRLKRKHKRIP
jgi:tetratricopeptide (TPR) repeat protein